LGKKKAVKKRATAKKAAPKKPTKKKAAKARRPSGKSAPKRALKKTDAELSFHCHDNSESIYDDVREMIVEARQQTALAVNAALTMTYWKVGDRIHREILNEQRADYGEQIVSTLSAQLVPEFGRGFSKQNLARMIRIAEQFPDFQIVSTLSRQLSWSHFVELIPFKDELQRDFYAEMCRIERWSVRALRSKIDGMLFERTALSKKPEKLVQQEVAALRDEDRLTPEMVFRDPYFLDFLGLQDTYSERDLEAAILRELEAFILELGAGFAFVGRQYRMVIDGEDHSLDLLFYHRRLGRLIAIDLKLGKFKAAYKGQMELYLRWLERHEQQSGEQSPLGLILCADKSDEQIELLRLDESGIHVSAYLTDLPPRELLKQKLHEAVRTARSRLEATTEEPTL
jgi:predicted nuclease of restriction endonuclease-like (RecB) superfamily